MRCPWRSAPFASGRFSWTKCGATGSIFVVTEAADMRGAIEGAERFIDQIAALLADKSTAHFPGDPHGPIVVADRDFGEVPMAEVFLSYSQMDRAAVERIAATLTSLGLSVWHDARLDSG